MEPAPCGRPPPTRYETRGRAFSKVSQTAIRETKPYEKVQKEDRRRRRRETRLAGRASLNRKRVGPLTRRRTYGSCFGAYCDALALLLYNLLYLLDFDREEMQEMTSTPWIDPVPPSSIRPIASHVASHFSPLLPPSIGCAACSLVDRPPRSD